MNVLLYQHFDTPESRDDLVNIGMSLAKEIFEKKIDVVFFIDRSARTAWLTLQQAWKITYPNEKMPKIYFTNPDGYLGGGGRGWADVLKDFNSTYKELSQNKNANIMLYDACMHSGNTIKPILNLFKTIGYTNISIGLAQPKDVKYSGTPQISYQSLNYIPNMFCRPFRHYSGVDKVNDSVLSVLHNKSTCTGSCYIKRQTVRKKNY